MTDSNGNPTSVWDQWFNTLTQALNNAGGSTLQPNAGGTGYNSYTNGQILIGNTEGNTLVASTITAGTNVTVTNGEGSIEIAVAISGGLSTADGGTGQTSYTNGQLLIGNSSGNGLNKSTLTAGTGIGITNGQGSITVSNTGINSLVSGTNITTSGSTVNTTVTLPLITKIVSQIFTSSGTYTPTTGMVYCVVEGVGGGGGGGGASVTGAGSAVCGGGGSSGYCRKVLTAAQIGTSASVTVGSGGSGGSGSGGSFAAGGNGSASSIGSLFVTSHGLGNNGGQVSAAVANIIGSYGADSGSTVADLYIPGNPDSGVATTGITLGSGTLILGMLGGIAPVFGSQSLTNMINTGSNFTFLNTTVNGDVTGEIPGGKYGSGGSGSGVYATATHTASYFGGNGANGIVTITEYCSV